MRPSLFCLLFLIAVCAVATACGPDKKIGESGFFPDASPLPLKQPPGSKDGLETAVGCNSVTAAGSCKEKKAVSCDVEAGSLKTIDCGALQKSCVVDPTRGARCEDVGANLSAGDSTDSSVCADTGIDYLGYCLAGVAVFCDTAEKQTVFWDCARDQLYCGEDTCIPGAFCCPPGGAGTGGTAGTGGSGGTAGAGGTGGTAVDPNKAECDRLGLEGECAGTKARWCQAGKIEQRDCPTLGKACEVDTCALGAYCCTPEPTECEVLGFDGICTANNKVRYCGGGSVREFQCTTTAPCQVDVCGSGALCCNPG